MTAALTWLAHAPWGRFTFILAMFAAFVAWGCWCQHTLDRDERRALERNEQARRVAEVQWARARGAAWLEQVDFAEWDAEVRG